MVGLPNFIFEMSKQGSYHVWTYVTKTPFPVGPKAMKFYEGNLFASQGKGVSKSVESSLQS